MKGFEDGKLQLEELSTSAPKNLSYSSFVAKEVFEN